MGRRRSFGNNSLKGCVNGGLLVVSQAIKSLFSCEGREEAVLHPHLARYRHHDNCSVGTSVLVGVSVSTQLGVRTSCDDTLGLFQARARSRVTRSFDTESHSQSWFVFLMTHYSCHNIGKLSH